MLLVRIAAKKLTKDVRQATSTNTFGVHDSEEVVCSRTLSAIGMSATQSSTKNPSQNVVYKRSSTPRHRFLCHSNKYLWNALHVPSPMVGKGLDRKQSGRLGAQPTAVEPILRVHTLLSFAEDNKNGCNCNESCF